MQKKNVNEATLCLGDALASRRVVGPGERTLLPVHVLHGGWVRGH